MVQFDTSGVGYLRVRTYVAYEAAPVPQAHVRIMTTDNTVVVENDTDENGLWENIALPCPPRALSLDINNTQIPYGVYNLRVTREGYANATVLEFQVFDGETSLAEVMLEPNSSTGLSGGVTLEPDISDVPPHHLFDNDTEGGTGRPPLQGCTPPRVLSEVVIPEKITVHLGKPSANVKNVTVTFRDYIKNVASSEVYPTWPEQALRANIHAQISLALNRIYTEWYRSKGYNFQITSSPSYDQYYVHGRTIFEPMSRITDDIFNTYVRKTGTVNPYFTEYCDGKTVTCPGMKQWGTVTRANEGMNALQILRYYYGNDIEIIRSSNIAAIPESYPGSPLRVGSSGTSVRVIQRQLNRIAKDYPFFGTVTVDGNFGTSTETVVKRFQKQFNLPQDGVVGRNTWYKISYIYVSVKDLAELTSEGEKPTGELVDGQYPGTALRRGSRGDSVMQIQFWLNELAPYMTELDTISVDGIFGAGTERAVLAFQRKFNLDVDGVVGRRTWDEIYSQYTSLVTDINPDTGSAGQYPGTSMTVGSRGDNVTRMQFYLRIVARHNSAVPDLAADGIFGAGTERSVRAFQSFYGLSVDGIVGKTTWDKLYEVYTDLINGLLAPSARPGTYPGSPLQMGSAGTSVKEMQYYLYLLSAYYASLPVISYDGVFGQATRNAVIAFQRIMGLTADGIVGRQTWNAIYSQFSVLRTVDGPVQSFHVEEYPGHDLTLGSEGSAVRFVQYLLNYMGLFLEEITPITAPDGVYDEETADAVRDFQRKARLTETGVVDISTWRALVAVYLSIIAAAGENANVPEGEYGGYVLTLGSAGQQVLRLQTYMNAIASRYCVFNYVNETGVFDAATLRAVEEFQQGFGLPVTGFVDRTTWDAIYNYYTTI